MTREYAEGPEGRVMLPHLHYTVLPIEEAESKLSTRKPIHVAHGTDADDGDPICPGDYEVIGWGRHPSLEGVALVELKEVVDASA